MSERPKSVSAERYSEEYFCKAVGGEEFFRAYGPKILKPQLAYAAQRANLAPGMRILDIGCGRGELLYHARQMGVEAIGTDFSGPALKLAREVSGCPVIRCDAKQLPFKDGLFDRVFMIGVVDHLHEWELEQGFSEISRVLKPGGVVLVHTCTNRLYYKNWSYGLRRRLARLLGRRQPTPPRSDEDAALHVNEHSVGDLVRFFQCIGWKAQVEPVPNYKLKVSELYGDHVPKDFPLKAIVGVKAAMYFGLLFHWPLNRFLAREIFAVATPSHKAMKGG